MQSSYKIAWIACVLMLGLAVSDSFAQGIRWQKDLEAAKITAQKTNRLVLLHFWSPSCGPCRKLDKTVFNQPQIGRAIEANYVPVKINASVSIKIAERYNISRIPTDVIITPQGQVIRSTISPSTPMAYASYMTETFRAFQTKFGTYFDKRVAQNPTMQRVNSAYANLNLSPQKIAGTPQARQVKIDKLLNRQPTNNPLPKYRTAALPVAPPQFQSAAFQPSRQPVNPAVQPRVPTQPQITTNRYSVAPPTQQRPAQYPAQQRPTQQRTAETLASQPSVISPAAQRLIAQKNNPYVKADNSLNRQPAARKQLALPNFQALVSDSKNMVTPALKKPAAPSQLIASSQTNMAPQALGFEGCCPVTLKKENRWAKGDTAWGAFHRGRTYLFVSQKAQQDFLANPDSYSPVFSGIDPVVALEKRRSVEGRREYGMSYQGRFYLFSTEASRSRFESAPARYADQVRQAMNRLNASSQTIRR